MIRRLLRDIGIIKTSFIIGLFTALSSFCMYFVAGALFGGLAPIGIVLSIFVPGILAPSIAYFLLRVSIRLELAEQALLKANTELELRVKQRTAELVRANEELQAEIAQRKQTEVALRHSEKQITASLREKEVLLQEVHHRVKNNLQVISSLLSLQSSFVQDQVVRKVFRDSQNRIRSMALIHEQLYQSQDLTKIDFADYIHHLATHLFRLYGVCDRAIPLNVRADGVFLGIRTAVPCGLILNELIANALKHAFPEGRTGEIHISLCEGDVGQWTLRVADTGVGFPADLDFRDTTSLGLQLVNMLAGQLNATIELDRSVGTEFKITFAAL
jgi:two-component sensor histidine kinase